MSDFKNNQKTNQEPATLDEIRELLKEFRMENKAICDQVLLRVESIYCRNPKPKFAKKSVVTKKPAVEKKESDKFPTKFSNTLYWWTAMYANDRDEIKKYYTEEDVKAAVEKIDGISNKPDGYEKKRAIGLQIWKGFSRTKRTTELKMLFENWKKEQEKANATNVERENDTDDDNGETEPKAVVDDE